MSLFKEKTNKGRLASWTYENQQQTCLWRSTDDELFSTALDTHLLEIGKPRDAKWASTSAAKRDFIVRGNKFRLQNKTWAITQCSSTNRPISTQLDMYQYQHLVLEIGVESWYWEGIVGVEVLALNWLVLMGLGLGRYWFNTIPYQYLQYRQYLFNTNTQHQYPTLGIDWDFFPSFSLTIS